MGISWSSNRRRYNAYPPPPPPYYYSREPHILPPPPPPPPPPQNQMFPHTHQPIHSFYHTSGYSSCSYPNSVVGRFHYHPYFANQPPISGWQPAIQPPLGPPQPLPPYVDRQNAKKVRNDVNLHKDTVRLEVDEQNPDHHLVSFVFDAMYDGSITIFYFAKEEPNCQFIPTYPDIYTPVKIPFQKGLGQKFRQPLGTGIDFGFFELDDLSKPSPGDVYPLVISAETYVPLYSGDDHFGASVPTSTSPHMQITQAVVEKDNGGDFQVRVIRQILWIDGVRYELRELYGIGSSSAQGFEDSDPGKECVICMTEPKDTAVLPCRHMCMCSECAKELRLQSNKCPICRQPIEELIEIKISNGSQ